MRHLRRWLPVTITHVGVSGDPNPGLVPANTLTGRHLAMAKITPMAELGSMGLRNPLRVVCTGV
jgi:hypothetical protein